MVDIFLTSQDIIDEFCGEFVEFEVIPPITVVKMHAKQLKKLLSGAYGYSACLNFAARKHGFQNYKHFINIWESRY